MSDELQVAVVNDPQTVAVPQLDVEVVVLEATAPIVVTSPDVQVVTIDEDVHVVEAVREIQVVTVGEAGVPGPRGATGLGMPEDGTTTGDMLRYNSVTEAWEVAAEPLHFKGIVLTPALAALSDDEGAIYYNSASKNVQVCTSDE